MKTLIVEIGMGIDLHGQDLTKAAVRACRNAIEHNSLPGLAALLPDGDRRHMQVRVTLGLPELPEAHPLDENAVRAVFPYGQVSIQRAAGGLLAHSGVVLPEKGDRNDAILVVVAAIEVGIPD